MTGTVSLSVEGQFRQVLCEMELFMHGTTASLDPSGIGGDGGGKPPTGESHPPHIEWRERWNRAIGTHQQEKTLEAAVKDLKAYREGAKGRKVSGENIAELEERIVKKCGEGWTVEEVAQHCRCNPKLVRVSWLKASVIPDEEKQPSKFQRARVKQLAGQKMSERDIAEMTKLSKTTIRRLLERAA
jgi:transposase